MSVRCLCWTSLFLCSTLPLAAQAPDSVPPGTGKRATAVRVAAGAIELDGALTEDAWLAAPAIDDFVQKEPVEGAAPTERMEVRFVYDDEGVYVGARMFSDDPAAIQAPLGRRDAVGSEAEQIFISLDTFLDRRTAYTFGVTASGVRFDRFHPRDEESGADSGFDPVWRAETRIDGSGWTAELWIPFTQLRFRDQPEQLWGLNVRRFTPTLEEEVYWAMVPRTERAWSSRFGVLAGIAGVEPSRRIELMPFVVGASAMNASPDPENPFDDGQTFETRAGLDLKMGLGPNLTLDATFNPDFGQVEADPAEVNLSAFATRFPERRPFFTEGAELLTPRHMNVFYTRRIGAPPIGRASGDYVDYPATSQILGAAKITGRLSGGRSLGVLTALTNESFARVANAGEPDVARVRVGPRAGYGVVRVEQELGGTGSVAALMLGAVHRQVGADDPLAALLSRNALVYGTDALIRFPGGRYELTWAAYGSHVEGEPGAIERIQRSSTHYMQRPDRTYARLDPTLTALSGGTFSVGFTRIAGTHWLFGITHQVDTPGFETNDIANLRAADGVEPRFNVTYRETQPGKLFRAYSVRVAQSNEWNWGWDRQVATLMGTGNVTWLNFWTTSLSVTRTFRTQDAILTRGGPLMTAPRGWRTAASLGNSSTAPTRWSASLAAASDELGGTTRQADFSLSIRPSPRWQLSVQPSYLRSTDSQQHVTTLAGGRPETFDSRYVFAYVARRTLSSAFRMSYTLKPDLNLDVYAEPFAASGRYFDFGELRAPRTFDEIRYGSEGSTLETQADGSRLVTMDGSTFRLPNRDFNVRSFNSNAVLRWEWRPGSTLYFVWQQNRDLEEPFGSPVGVRDVFGSLTAPGSNVVQLKASWWLPVD